MAEVFTFPDSFPFTPLDVSTLLVFIVTFVLAARFLKKVKNPGNLPPSVPGGWPLLDHLPTLVSTNPRLQFDEWARELGDIYRVKALGDDIYVVSGYTTIKEMMEKEELSTRRDRFMSAAMGGGHGVNGYLTSVGEGRIEVTCWRRMAASQTLATVPQSISGYSEQPFDVSSDLTTAAGNIICALVFGKRFDYGDTRFQYLQTTMKDFGADLAKYKFPFIHYIPIVQDGAEGLRFHSKKLQQFIREEIDQHRLNLNPGDPRDFMDHCLLQLDQQDGGGTWLNEDNVVYIIQDLFVAGTDTTAATLTWALLYMVLYPDVQKKVRENDYCNLYIHTF
ncbi:cytochrome P450 2J6-like [Branchiostoma lanceolatum]|uniref:cytochrome P450 2J6-like n=1 Tax=Branchiostoma lanceolatum TaxID=7740 RepID=UPI00345241BA